MKGSLIQYAATLNLYGKGILAPAITFPLQIPHKPFLSQEYNSVVKQNGQANGSSNGKVGKSYAASSSSKVASTSSDHVGGAATTTASSAAPANGGYRAETR